MAKHQKIVKSIINLDKRWNNLKQGQKEQILQMVDREYAIYISRHVVIPLKGKKLDIIDQVYENVRQMGIWVPYIEAKINISKRIDRLNHKHITNFNK